MGQLFAVDRLQSQLFAIDKYPGMKVASMPEELASKWGGLNTALASPQVEGKQGLW